MTGQRSAAVSVESFQLVRLCAWTCTLLAPLRKETCLGRLNVVTPFHPLSGDSHLNRSLAAGPITASSNAAPNQKRCESGENRL